MKFAQIVELKTSRLEELKALDQEWIERTEGTRPRSVEIVCADRDRPNTYLVVVQWDSYEDAQRNNNLPATHEFSQKIAKLCDGPPTFRNLDVIEERT